MSDTVDIGAARVRLIVDSAEFEQVIAQGKNAVRSFGTDAQAAYDRTEKGTRRAADALLDYVSGLGRADSSMDKYLRTASRMGVEKPILDAATLAWATHNDKVEQAAIAQAQQAEAVKRSQAAYKELISTQQAAEAQQRALANAQAATRIGNLADARAANSQNDINALVAPGLAVSTETTAHRLAAEEAFRDIILQENKLIELQEELQKQLAAEQLEHVAAVAQAHRALEAEDARNAAQALARSNAEAATRIQNLEDARAAQSQQAIDALVAPGLAIDPATSAHRQAAEEVFAGIIERENAALEEQLVLQKQIDAARSDITQSQKQQDWNKLLGIKEQQSAYDISVRRQAATSALTEVVEREAAAESAAAEAAQKQKSFIAQLEALQTSAGKGYYELLQLKAAQLGISSTAGPMIDKLKQTNQALGAGTISAKQYEFAVRGLPAQFTDVFVSLAAGQNPLTVLLQQGGQVKDMFGGIKTAVVAVGNELGKLIINPWVLLAGALATVAVNAYQAQQRITSLAIATAKGSLVAGDATQLSAFAEQLDKLKNINLSSADAAVSSLAEAGLLFGKNFNIAAEAAARWASITGEAADTVTAKFNEVARDPMAAVLDGTLKLTDAQYQQLLGLERVGDKTSAAQLAVKLYADQINANSASVLSHLSDEEKGWKNIKDAVSSAWHELLNFRRTEDEINTFSNGGLDGAIIGLPGPQVPTQGPSRTRSGFGGVGTDAGVVGDAAKLTRDQIDANKDLQKSYDDLGTKQQIYATELTKLQNTIKNSSAAQREALKINLDATGALSGPGYAKLVEGLRLKVFGQGPDPTKEIKAWEKAALEAIKTTQTAADIAFSDQQLSAEQYYKVAAQLARDDAQIEIESIDKQKAALKGRANSEDAIAALNQQRAAVVTQLNATELKLTHDSEVAIRARTAAYHDYVQALADANIALSRQGDQQVRAVGMGDRQAALLNAQDNARQAEALAERAAQDRADAAGGGAEAQAKADKEKQAAADALSTQLSILQGNYNNLATAEASWLNGSKKAWDDWQTSVSNNAAEAGKVFGIVMNDISSDIADAATTGHLSFKNLLNDLLREVTEYGAKQALLLAGLKLGLGGKPGTPGAGGVDYAGLIGSSGAGGAAASGIAGLISLYSGSFGGGFYAKGGVFPMGSGLSSHRNSVVSQPTYFPFAKGGVPNVGLMGEKSGSPGEAIMPLTRTGGGELAVKATSMQQPKVINTYQTFVVPGAVDRSTQSQLAIKAGGAASRAARRA